MSPTHDMIIDNSTGANVRADINNALAALVSNSSSSSEPSTKYAYQFWADTTTGILKIRNSANNAWVELLQLDGTLTLEDGSASTPGLAFRDDLNTGIYSAANDTFNVATGGVDRLELGTETVFNNTGADVDFRIEGDTEPNLFYVDAGNDRVGIGTTSPSGLLHISGNSCQMHFTDEDDSSSSRIYMSGSTFAIDVDQADAKGSSVLKFRVDDSDCMVINSSGNVGIGLTSPSHKLHIDGVSNDAYIRIQRSGAGDTAIDLGGIQWKNSTNNLGQIQCRSVDINDGVLKFSTMGAGTLSERMVINNSGYVGVGTSSPSFILDAKGATTDLLRLGNTGETSHGSHDAKIVAGGTYYQNPTIVGREIKFRTFNTSASEGERVKITADGDVSITNGVINFLTSGNGIDFSATSDATGKTSELLDDYEEGTWTPAFIATGGGLNVGYALQLGKYIKVGKLIHVSLYIILNAVHDNGSGNLKVSGLPYSHSSTNNHYSALPIGYYANTNNVVMQNGLVNNNDTTVHLYHGNTTTTANNSTPSAVLTTSFNLIMSGTYYTQ